MSATNELRTNRIIGSVDDGKKVVTAFADVEAALRTVFGIPANTAMSEAMTITNATGNVTMTGTLSSSTVPTSDLHAANRLYVTQSGGTSAFGNSRAIVALASNQAIAGNVPLWIPWYSSLVDTGGFWSSGNPTRFTIPTDGEYMVGLNAYVNLDLGIWFQAVVNRSTYLQLGYLELDAASYAGISTAIYLDDLSAGDYVEMRVFPRTYSSTTLYAAYTSAWIVRVA